MAMNAELDLSPIIPYLLKSTYGVIFLCILGFFASIIFGIYLLIKSGLLTSIRELHEFKSSKIDAHIKTQKELLNDPDFSGCKDEIAYNLKLTKLEKLLNFKHHDLDLLLYILSCRNNKLAISYYESSKGYLDKDQVTKSYKLKDGWRTKFATSLYNIGTIIYFSICIGSFYPVAFVIFYSALIKGESLKNLHASFFVSQFFLFVICLILALFILTPMVKPWQAKQFLELEKISSTE
ncbi:hypothetical protein [Acinetobacter sp. ANC 3791]|uniref:hypothetical protein n=1 Tax=Acinetobacter sp. ANC 3791 TaxID=2529836 RepID=UPI00103E5565|nr:hypothetical protein [Acinetobacter sp. ANC 3791]TCB86314.1 hypothetical protein E0H90_00365 [Acinetobacter sp. ANC 3791]